MRESAQVGNVESSWPKSCVGRSIHIFIVKVIVGEGSQNVHFRTQLLVPCEPLVIVTLTINT